jgi:hypothetical protein
MKRVKYGKEPVLHIHRYVISVGFSVKPKKDRAYWHTNYQFCMNLKEARAVRNEVLKRRPSAVIEIYKAHHDFREAWKK